MQRINSQMLISHAISILNATLHFKQNQVMHLHNICLPTIFRPRLLVLTETRGGWGLACRAVPAAALSAGPAAGSSRRRSTPSRSTWWLQRCSWQPSTPERTRAEPGSAPARQPNSPGAAPGTKRPPRAVRSGTTCEERKLR